MHPGTTGGARTNWGEEPMIHRLMIGAVSAAALTLSAAAFAREDQFGTAQEAWAMLDKVVAAV